MTTFPRILLVNVQPIGSKTAVGHTLKNLFAEWPKEKLAQIVEVSNSQGIASDIPTWVIGNGKLLRKPGMINLVKAMERRRNRGLYLENESVTIIPKEDAHGNGKIEKIHRPSIHERPFP